MSRRPHPLLADLALWTSHHLPASPLLVGAVPDARSMKLQLVDLEPLDPLDDLRRLIASPEWSLVVVRLRIDVDSGSHIGPNKGPTCARLPSVLTHALDRSGHSATEWQHPDETRSPPRRLVRRIDAACRDLLELDRCVY